MKKITKIVDWLLAHEDTEPFREPVDWRGLELFDYPEIIDKMMDLGTVKRKLDRGQYSTTHDVAEDVRLVWHNCMSYNAEGSDFWLLAKSFLRRFEDRYRKIRQEYDVGYVKPKHKKSSSSSNKNSSSNDKNNNNNNSNADGTSSAPNTTYTVPSGVAKRNLDGRAQFGADLFLLSGYELGYVMTQIEKECPQILDSWGHEKVELNVDAIPTEMYEKLRQYVHSKIGSKRSRKSSESSVGRPKKKKRSH